MARHVDFTPARLARVVLWGKLAAPGPMRRQMFDFRVSTLAREELRRRRRDRRPPATGRPQEVVARATNRAAQDASRAV